MTGKSSEFTFSFMVTTLPPNSEFLYPSFTLPDPDTDSDSDCKPNGYISNMQNFSHCIESDSESNPNPNYAVQEWGQNRNQNQNLDLWM